MGSKRRIAYDLLPIILGGGGDWDYIEPFVGGFNMMDKVRLPNRIANDINPYLIALFKKIRDGWQPPNKCSEEFWMEVRDNKDKYPAELVGFVGFTASFGGYFFGSYARSTRVRNWADEGRRNLLKQAPLLQGIDMRSGSYLDLQITRPSIIYCDPPYKNTAGYNNIIDYEQFWQWCRDRHDEGHKVFVSEYNAPTDFNCAWQKIIKSCLNLQVRSESVEKLFTLHNNMLI